VDTRKHRATFFADLLDVSQILAAARTLFRPRKDGLRAKILVLCSLVFFTTFYYGKGTLEEGLHGNKINDKN
jgi:hypothetical protein